MNVKRSWLATFLFCGLFAFSSLANAPINPDTKSVNKQFQKLLKDVKLGNLRTDLTVYVNFILNDKGEISVMSTSNNDFETQIKNILNDKIIESGSLKYGKKYTIPVSFKR